MGKSVEPVLNKTIGPEKFYLDNLGAGRFLIQRCDSCHNAIFYPRNVCPHCACTNLNWFEPAGKGTVYATTTVHPAKGAGDPYNVCLVDLDEGVRLMARVADVRAEDVRIGMQVTSKVEGTGDTARLVFVTKEH